MSLYREAGRRRHTTALAVGAALVVGLVAGLLVGRATKATPSLAEQVDGVQTRTREVVQGLELVRLHYATDRDAAVAQAERARAAFGDVSGDLRALDPQPRPSPRAGSTRRCGSPPQAQRERPSTARRGARRPPCWRRRGSRAERLD